MGFGYAVNAYYQLLYLETEWTDNVQVTDVSISDYLVNGTGELYPASASWTLSTNSVAEDALWGGSTLDLISIATNQPYIIEPEWSTTYASDYYSL